MTQPKILTIKTLEDIQHIERRITEAFAPDTKIVFLSEDPQTQEYAHWFYNALERAYKALLEKIDKEPNIMASDRAECICPMLIYRQAFSFAFTAIDIKYSSILLEFVFKKVDGEIVFDRLNYE